MVRYEQPSCRHLRREGLPLPLPLGHRRALPTHPERVRLSGRAPVVVARVLAALVFWGVETPQSLRSKAAPALPPPTVVPPAVRHGACSPAGARRLVCYASVG